MIHVFVIRLFVMRNTNGCRMISIFMKLIMFKISWILYKKRMLTPFVFINQLYTQEEEILTKMLNRICNPK